MSRARPDRDELVATLERVMRQASAQGVLFSHAVAERLGMNSTDLECLDIIIMREAVTAGELAEATGLTTGAITGVIDRLERAGYARRERDREDRRKVYVRALPAVGRKMGPLFEPMRQAFLSSVADLNDKELALLLRFFARATEGAVAATAALLGDAKSKRKGRDSG